MGTDCSAKLAAHARRKSAIISCMTALAVFSQLSGQADAQIELPPPPTATPPPVIPQDHNPGVEARKERIEKRKEDKKEKIEQETQSREAKKEQVIKDDLKKPRPLYGFLELSLLYPKITTQGVRKNYHADVTSHVQLWGRLRPDTPSDSIQIWAGFRLAPFSGYGTQDKETGRFGFSFFGPGLGFGSVKKVEDSSNEESPSYSGWLITSGVAAVSKLASDTHSDHESDFSSSAWSSDGPGVWVEGRYMRIFHAALSANLIIGAQLAKDKNFTYFGVGLGGWL